MNRSVHVRRITVQTTARMRLESRAYAQTARDSIAAALLEGGVR